MTLGAACAEMKLVTGGSGAAIGLPANFRQAGLIPARDAVAPTAQVGGVARWWRAAAPRRPWVRSRRMRALHPPWRWSR
jgi:hypothetical protein